MRKFITSSLTVCGLLVANVCLADLNHSQKTTVLEDQIVYLPVPPPPPPPKPKVVAYVVRPSTAHAQEILKAIDNTNALRAEKGLPALRYDDNLSAYAQFRATEIEKKFSHTRPNGDAYKIGMNIGSAVGENIAAGRGTADEAVLQFRNSPKHYATILHDKFTKIGMGMVYLPDTTYKYYWVQIFGADNTESAYDFDPKSPASQDAPVLVKADDKKLDDKKSDDDRTDGKARSSAKGDGDLTTQTSQKAEIKAETKESHSQSNAQHTAGVKAP